MSGNNTAIQPTVVIAQTDLSVVKTDSADPVAPGENFTYTVTVTKLGPSDATGVTARANGWVRSESMQPGEPFRTI